MTKLINGKPTTKEQVIKLYEGLIHHMAIKWRGDYSDEDLVSEGMIGLMQAYDRYDPSKNNEFLIFARPYIQGYMLKLMRKPQGATVPHGIVELGWSITRNDLYELPAAEIAEKLGKPRAHVERALVYLHTRTMERWDKSLVDGEDTNTLADITGRPDDHTNIFVSEFINSLDGREQTIVQCLYKEMPQREIAAIIGVSQMQVSRLIKKIGEKYREYNLEGVS